MDIYTASENGNVLSCPLLPVALQILDNYARHPKCINQDCALPILSNQKMNAYLKELADVCSIPKVFTFHLARHTFATTITLSNARHILQ
jgi:integrase